MIRTDNAPAFQKLLNESSKENSIFKTLNITLHLGDTLNSNKNSIAENAVKELEKEFLRLGFSNQQIQPLVLSLAVKNINSRIRHRGFSSREMCFMRSQTSNENIKLHDPTLSKTQVDLREEKHNKPPETNVHVSVGTLVMIKDKLKKNEARETYVVVQLDDVKGIPHAVIQKFEDKFMNRQYRIPVASYLLTNLISKKTVIIVRMQSLVTQLPKLTTTTMKRRIRNQLQQVQLTRGITKNSVI